MSDLFTVHHTVEKGADRSIPDPHQDAFSMTYLGFWVYLMTDCLLFMTLFLAYAVYQGSTFGGPTSKDLYDLKTAFAETMILLTSSLTCGLAVLASIKGSRKKMMLCLAATFLLGASFIALELHEFSSLVQEGNSWERSAFLSSFFTLVGTHGTHVSFGLLWLVVLCGQLLYQGINVDTFRRLALFSLFWHFLDLIWIFIFTFVYLMGVL